MEFNRTKNSTRTFIFGVINRLITIVGPFITRTIIIYKLGTEYLGLSSLFTSVLSILNISELGIGSAIAFCMYKPVAADDKETIRALLSLLRRLYKIIGIIIFGVGLVLLPFLPLMIKGEYPSDINIYILYMVYLLNSCASYLGFAYKAVLFNVYQRGDITHKIELCSEIIKTILQIIVLLAFSDYYLFVCILPISTIIVTVVNQWVSKRVYPDLVPKGEVSQEIKKTIKKKVLYLSAHSIASTLTNTADNIVISSAIGLSAIALYGNYHYISSSVMGFLLIAYRTLIPVIGNSLISKSQKENLDLFHALNFFCFWIITFCCSSLLCLYQPFMMLWVGEDNLLSFTVVIMVTAYFYANASRQLFSSYVSAAGLWNKTLMRQIIAAISNLVLDLILVGRFGIAGIVFSSFFTNSIISLPMDIYVTYKFILNDKTKNGFIKIGGYTFLTFILCLVSYLTCSLIKCSGILEIIYKALVCLILPNLLIFLFFCKSQNYAYVKNHLFSIIKRS